MTTTNLVKNGEADQGVNYWVTNSNAWIASTENPYETHYSFLFGNANCVQSSAMTQNINTKAGTSYTVSFYAMVDSGYSYPTPPLSLNIINGAYGGVNCVLNPPLNSDYYTNYICNFKAMSTQAALSFTGSGGYCNQIYYGNVYLDTISAMPQTYSTAYVTTSSYVGSSANEDFVINSSGDAVITGGGGNDMYTIPANPGANIAITDFNSIDDLIDLTAFSYIHSFSDLNITSSSDADSINMLNIPLSNSSAINLENFNTTATSTIINLHDNEKVTLLSLAPSNLTADDFMFAPTSENSDSSSNTNELIIGATVGGVGLLGAAAGYAYYAYTHHIWPFVVDSLASKVDAGIEISGV